MSYSRYLVVVATLSVLASGLAGFFVLSEQNGQDISATNIGDQGLTDAPTPKDIVTVTVHDKYGNLVGTQTTHNIITTAGAAFFCIQTGLCAGGANGAIGTISQSLTGTSAAPPTYWIQFVNGSSANTNEPTAADCSVSSTNDLVGQTTGTGSSTKCAINFGSAPAQYPSGTNNLVATLCVSATSCTGDLRAPTGIVDTSTSTYTLATQVFGGCSPNSNGTAPSSGTCVNDQQTSVFTNNVSGKMVITGLGLFGGTNAKVVGGPTGSILVAEASLSPTVTLNPGDTIQVTWQITI